MKKYFFIIKLFCAGVSYQLYAQSEIDAFRYSQVQYGSTARAAAMGGSFGALGGDFSSLSINPAGIGIYKNSESTITPSLYFKMLESDFNHNITDDSKSNFNFGNVGVVFVAKPKNNSGCKAIQFGMGLNHLNNYNYRSYIEGGNPQNSILDDFKSKAQGTFPEDLDPFDTRLAYNTYLIDTFGSLTNYITPIPKGGALQQESMNVSGSNNEIVITFGGNLNDKLYMGGTFGFPFIRYIESSVYEETDIADTIPDFEHMIYNNYLETHGTGFNFKFGVIYRIADWVRVGAAIHTPTFLAMNDKWNSDMSSKFDDGYTFYDNSPHGEFHYKLNTPFKFNASLGFVIGKYALITGEYELVDYRMAHLKSDDYSFNEENRAIDNNYAAQSNIRAGFEIKINDFALRGGYTFCSNPYAKESQGNNSQIFSGGAGFKFDRFFIDVAYSYNRSEEKYYMYSSAMPADIKFDAHKTMLTFGVKF